MVDLIAAINAVDSSVSHTAEGQTIAIVVGGAVLAIFGYAARKVGKIAKDVRTFMSLAVTPKATTMNPHPAPGFLDTIALHGTQLDSLDRSVGVLLTGQKAMLDQRAAERDANGHDLNPVDALRAIQDEQNRRARERSRHIA